jgi:hypothetical protein
MSRKACRRAVTLALAGLLAAVPAMQTAGAEEASGVDPKAAAQMQRMVDYLAGLTAFRLRTETTLEVVLETGQKIQFGSVVRGAVQRPDRLRADREGDVVALSLYYDGSHVTLWSPHKQYYASKAAPATLDEVLGFLEEELDMAAPAADLLYSDGGAELLKEATSGLYVGVSEVDGARCHHLAFRAEDVDWQIWIEDGERPLPRKYVITTRDVEGLPQFEVRLGDWEVAAAIPDEEFTFTPPEGATRIEIQTPDAAGSGEEG